MENGHPNHLSQSLDRLTDAIIDLSRDIRELRADSELTRQDLIAPATGRKQMPLATAHLVFRILGGVMLAQTLVIAILLVGEKAGLIANLTH